MNGKLLTFVADESCDFAVVRALRKAGFDVLAIIEAKPGAPDSEILNVATRQGSILLTEDKDFGEWVFAHGQSAEGPACGEKVISPEVARVLFERISNQEFVEKSIMVPVLEGTYG